MKLDPTGKEKISQAFPLVSNPRQLKAGQAGRWRVAGGVAFGVGKGNGEYETLGRSGASGGGAATFIPRGASTDVKDWGAVGNGAADDTTAIQRALDGATDGEVFFSAGTYVISSTLTVTRPITLRFAETAQIVCAEGFSHAKMILVTTGDFTAYGLRLDGANLPHEEAAYLGTETDPKGIGIKFLGTSAKRLSNIRLYGGTIANTPFPGAWLEYVDDGKLVGVTADGCSAYAISDPPAALYGVQCRDCGISGCNVSASGRKGISFGASASCDITNNHVSDGLDAGHAALYLSSSRDCAVVGNTVTNCCGVKVSHACDNFIVANNTFTGAKSAVVILQGCKNGEVCSNVSRDAATDADGFYIQHHPTYRLGLENIHLHQNIFTNSAPSTGYGILLDSAEPSADRWRAGDVKEANEWVVPTVWNGYAYRATAGTTGATEPTWPTTPGQTIDDGTVTWLCFEYGKAPLSRFTICDNTFDGYAYGLSVFTVTPAARYEDMRVSRNTFRNIGDTAIRLYGARLEISDNTIDGVTANQGILLNSAGSTEWSGGVGYNTMNYVTPTVFNGYVYHCIMPGTSGANQPDWANAPDPDNIADGEVIWQRLAWPSSETVRVSGNTLRNLHTGHGIYALGGSHSLFVADALEVAGNTVDMTGTTNVYPLNIGGFTWGARLARLAVIGNTLICGDQARAIYTRTESGTPLTSDIRDNTIIGSGKVIEYDNAADVGDGWEDGNLNATVVDRPLKARPYQGTAAPTTGAWAKGDFVRNTDPAANEPLGWLCTASGAPGTWIAAAPPATHQHAGTDITSAVAEADHADNADSAGDADTVDGSHAADFAPAAHGHAAADIAVDAEDFTGNLSAADTDVQTALATLDALPLGSGGNFAPNLLINGGVQFWQRQVPGTATSRTDDTYCADRWYVLTQTGAVSTSRTAGIGVSPYALLMSQDLASPPTGQRMGVAQIVESVNSVALRGQEARFAAVVASDSTRTINYALLEWTGTADAVTSDVVEDWTDPVFDAGNFFLSSNITVVAAGSVTPDSGVPTNIMVGGTISTNCTNLIVCIWTEEFLHGQTLTVSDADLYPGTAARPFTLRPVGEELGLCQRYCYAIGGELTTDLVGFGHAYNTTTGVITVPLPVTMLAKPGISYSAASDWVLEEGGTSRTITNSITVSGPSTAKNISLNCIMSSAVLTQFRPQILRANSTANARIVLSAEL